MTRTEELKEVNSLMAQYSPLAAAADRLNVGVPWFLAEVHPSIEDKFRVVGEWMYSIEELDKWKHDRDTKRSRILDELTIMMEEDGGLWD